MAAAAMLPCALCLAVLIALRAPAPAAGLRAPAPGASPEAALGIHLPAAAGNVDIPCLLAVAGSANQSLGLAKLVLAQGLSLPYDAGKYEMCMAVPHARYFLASAEVPLSTAAAGAPRKPLTVRLGLCLPRQCSRGDAAWVVREAAAQASHLAGGRGVGAPTKASASSPQLDLRQPGLGTRVAAAVLGLLLCLVLWASCGPSGAPLPIAVFELSGPQGSWAKMWECRPRGGLDCLNGMRAISMFWVVVGHSFLYSCDVTGGFANMQDIYRNPLNPEAVERHPPGLLLIMNGQVVVDTFLLISGLLQSIQMLELLHAAAEGDRRGDRTVAGSAKHGRLFLAGIAQRYLRLTPSLLLVWLCYHFLLPYIARGPFAPRLQEQILSRCDETWWASFLYAQALFPANKDRMCMKWTWYLSCDMIYFAIGLVLLPLHLSRPRLLWASLAALFVGSLAWSVVLANRYPLELDPSWVHSAGWGAVYVNPVVRIVPYIVGVAAGILEHNAAQGARAQPAGVEEAHEGGESAAEAAPGKAASPEQRSRSALAAAAAWAALAAALAVMALVVMLPQTDLGDRHGSWRTWQMTLYTVASRPAWALSIACVALLCRCGRPAPVAAFLAHPLWTPLARLTYGAYLAHPLVIKLAAGRQLQFSSFSCLDFAQRCLANALMAYGCSALLWILAERPVAALASASLRRPQGKADLEEKKGTAA